MRRIILLNIVFCLLTAALTPAATRLVPDKYPGIQAAINDCNDGDVVIVAPGTYFEMINLKGKNITLRSTDPNNPNVVAATIIDGGARSSAAVLNNSGVRFNPRVVTFNSGEGPDCVLNGLTITNGRSGGVYCEDSSPTLLRCVFTHNRARGGGGMYNKNSTPTLINCTFSSNSASMSGGGVSNRNSSPNLVKCTFTRNSAGGGGGMSNSRVSKPMLTNCIFSRNSAEVSGGAISSGGLEDSAPTLKNCTLVGNSAGVGGGGIYHGVALGRLKIINCIFWGNRDRDKIVAMAQIRNSATAGAVINYSCIEGLGVPDEPEGLLYGPYGSGTGNIGKDPLFADPNNGDYHLRSQAGRWDLKTQKWVRDDVTSPCVDAGDPNSLIADEPLPNNGAVNMGAYGGTSKASKSLARSTEITLPAGLDNITGWVKLENLSMIADRSNN